MQQTIDLTQGGIAVVMVGSRGYVAEFSTDPRIRFIDCLETPLEQLQNLVPDNTKIFIISPGVPEKHYAWTVMQAKKRNILYLQRNSNQAIYELLKSLIPDNNIKPNKEEVKETMVKGKLKDIIEMADWSLSNADNARKLLPIATSKGITTTFGSLAQGLATARRKQQGGTVPKSARNKLDVSVEMLDNTIKELTDMREFLIALTEENRILKARIKKIEEAFK